MDKRIAKKAAKINYRLGKLTRLQEQQQHIGQQFIQTVTELKQLTSL